jgi:SulP family sulfate permease
MLTPKLFTTLRSYDRHQLSADVKAGVIVGIVALPLAIAFAIASGVSPDRGLYTAIIAGFLISVLGGSRVQIGGPTGAFVVIVYGIVQEHGTDGLIVATIMAGIILVGLGVGRLGSAIKFIPHPVVTGFTSGIALIIFFSQIKDLLGLRMGPVPAEFLDQWRAYAEHLSTFDPATIALSGIALATILLWPRVSRRVPGPLVALILASVLARALDLDVETLGTRFGEISASIPAPSLPTVDLATVTALIGPAFTIAMLGGIESLLSAVVADGMIGGRHRSNMELVGQGIANIVTPLFGGIPATGAIARTATNVRNGGRTPVAGVVHALTLLLITLFFGKWVSYIPFAALSAILLVVSYHMSEWRAFKAEFTAPKSDVLVMLTTFTLTVTAGLTLAIQVGLVLAALLFMKRMAEVTNVQAVTRELRDNGDVYATDPGSVRTRDVPDGVEIFEINGPFFFGAAQKFKEHVEAVLGQPRVLILRMRNVPAIDSTGMHALGGVVHASRRRGTLVILSDVHAQPMFALAQSYLADDIGEENIVGDIDAALTRARAHMDPTGDDSHAAH